MQTISGAICDTVTFYEKDFKINEELNSLLVRHILTNGADSLILFGNTGEGILFSDKLEQKIKLINLALEASGGKNPILVGVYSNEVENSIDQMEDLAKKFNDINFIVSPPISEKISNESLKLYFENILGAINFKNQIYLHNNPDQFAGNEIEPEILNSLRDFPNLKGLNDSFYNIKNCKSYIQLLNDDFSVHCGMEDNFQNFFQLISLEERKFSGIVSSIGNLVNLSSKLYYFALEDKVLEVHQLQDQINDIRNKIYDVKINNGKERRGLKYAFLHLYKERLKNPIKEISIISPKRQIDLEEITKGRIEATVNYLLNQKQIYQLYFLGKKELYQFKEIIKTFSDVDVLIEQGKLKKIIGPFDAIINTIYRVNFEKSHLIFRFRTCENFPFENIAKEKLLYPFLDGTLSGDTNNLTGQVNSIVSSKMGAYLFHKDKPPIVPVGNLIYYDETKETVPYIFTVQDYIHGKPLHWYLKQYLSEGIILRKTKFQNLFKDLGMVLGKLHQINFDSPYENIKEIGKRKDSISEIFNKKLENQIQEAKRHKFEFLKEIRDYIRDNEVLIEDQIDFALLHNDFQGKNIIVKEESTNFQIKGLIDFDDWCVGSRAQDFVKIEYLTLKNLERYNFIDAFYEGYSKYFKIDKEFIKKIEMHKILWLLKEFNIEVDIKNKTERPKLKVDTFPLTIDYENEIRRLLF
jgi:dihydrodipicolinate synthase/N-acetylneuraminate lyase/Ser/Thr protein kinase RdoA (MazF antagonist)